MVQENILSLMIVQHGFLESLFSTIEIQINDDSQKIEDSLAEFSLALKNHFFIEEEVVFNFMAWKKPEILETINHLKKEHSLMIESLEKFENNLKEINQQEIKDFAKLLKDHRNLEEENLYPKLDESLTEAQKDQIIERIYKIQK